MNHQIQHAEGAVVNPKKIAATNGLIWAAINIVIFLLTYYSMPQLMGSMTYGIVVFLISIGLGVYFVLDLRKKIGGYWSFREALGNIFFLFLVQYLVYYLFSLGFPYLEPGYADMMRDIRLNSATEMAEMFGGDNQDQIDAMIEQVEVALELEMNPTFAHILQTIAISIIMYFIGALIFAAIFKRERPVFAPATPENDVKNPDNEA